MTRPRSDPTALLNGPMVCLLNEFSASDGDIFPYRFRQHKLGKLIGKRSWGGVVGIRGTLPLLDGGITFGHTNDRMAVLSEYLDNASTHDA